MGIVADTFKPALSVLQSMDAFRCVPGLELDPKRMFVIENDFSVEGFTEKFGEPQTYTMGIEYELSLRSGSHTLNISRKGWWLLGSVVDVSGKVWVERPWRIHMSAWSKWTFTRRVKKTLHGAQLKGHILSCDEWRKSIITQTTNDLLYEFNSYTPEEAVRGTNYHYAFLIDDLRAVGDGFVAHNGRDGVWSRRRPEQRGRGALYPRGFQLF